MKLTGKHLIISALIGFAIFALSGMFDFITAFYYEGKVAMQNPIRSAFSPVALMLCIFGFTGVWLLIQGSGNLKGNVDLGKKQITASFIMLLTVYLAYEVLMRVPILLS